MFDVQNLIYVGPFHSYADEWVPFRSPLSGRGLLALIIIENECPLKHTLY
tara:strand:+ start:122 stop:271 length:150 start_codon:yes stop_codon:yes gene_type:complete